uniref:Endonuclease/exonuclease/phosphatase domain-containing protein n=2 Tax=Manihot esculenta TaxID=3983 RepID=A0A2C9UFL8_MANES
MGFEDSAFTWSRGLSSYSLQRAWLDRALCSPNWQFRFPHAYVTHPDKFHSDHYPLVVSLNIHVHRMEGPFHFQLAWMNHANLGMIVGNALNSFTDILDSIKNLALDLCLWNRNSFGNIFSRKKRILARIAGIQKTLSTGGPQHLLKLELKLKKQLEDILEQEELFCFQS